MKLLFVRAFFHFAMVFTYIVQTSKYYFVVKPIVLEAQSTLVFTCLQNKSFENNTEKGERAISPFSTLFSTYLGNFLPFSSNSKLSPANSFSLEESKICRLGKS